MEDLTIRKATEEDFQDFNKLMHQVHIIHTAARPDIYRENSTVFSKERFSELANEGSVLLATSGGKTIGTAVCLIRHMSSPNHVGRTVMVLDSIAVDEEYRHMGVGRLLVKSVEEKGRSAGCVATELHVCAFNKQAIEAYRHMGYGDKSIIMEKKL